MKMNNLVITIDGPAGSGKSTIAKLLAEKLGVSYLDTGAMYRAITLTAMKAGFDLTDTEVMLAVISRNKFEFECKNDQMAARVNGTDITDKIRLPEVTENVHFIASNPDLREILVKMQQQFAHKQGRIVTEGRDQGTVAFPCADIKFFLTADENERAKRRQIQLNEAGIGKPHNEILEAIKERDLKDTSRKVGALKPAGDAIIIDTTNFNIEQVVEKLLCEIQKKKLQ